jgi:hypothetical protein
MLNAYMKNSGKSYFLTCSWGFQKVYIPKDKADYNTHAL